MDDPWFKRLRCISGGLATVQNQTRTTTQGMLSFLVAYLKVTLVAEREELWWGGFEIPARWRTGASLTDHLSTDTFLRCAIPLATASCGTH